MSLPALALLIGPRAVCPDDGSCDVIEVPLAVLALPEGGAGRGGLRPSRPIDYSFYGLQCSAMLGVLAGFTNGVSPS